MAQTLGFDPTVKVKTCFDCKMFDVANWIACLNGEDGCGGTPSLEFNQLSRCLISVSTDSKAHHPIRKA